MRRLIRPFRHLFLGLTVIVVLCCLLATVAQSQPTGTVSGPNAGQGTKSVPAGESAANSSSRTSFGIELKPLTLFEFLYLLLTFCAAAGALLSIVALIRQARASSDASVAQETVSVDRVFVDHPYLRKYFLGGCDISAEHEHYDQALAASQLLANYFESYCRQRRKTSQLYDEGTWKAYMTEHLRNSPVLCRYIERYKDCFTDDLVNLMRTSRPL